MGRTCKNSGWFGSRCLSSLRAASITSSAAAEDGFCTCKRNQAKSAAGFALSPCVIGVGTCSKTIFGSTIVVVWPFIAVCTRERWGMRAHVRGLVSILPQMYIRPGAFMGVVIVFVCCRSSSVRFVCVCSLLRLNEGAEGGRCPFVGERGTELVLVGSIRYQKHGIPYQAERGFGSIPYPREREFDRESSKARTYNWGRRRRHG